MKIGDSVLIRTLLNGSNQSVSGVIVASYDDDSDCLLYPTKYWLVRTSDGNLHDCLDDQLKLITT
jgi:hypothetical protein